MGTTHTVKGHTYVVGKLSAMKQFHVVRRLAPLLLGLVGKDKAKMQELKGLAPEEMLKRSSDMGPKALSSMIKEIAAMDDKSAEFIIMTCLGAVERKQGTGGWAALVAGGELMFEDVDMVGMLTLVGHVLMENLSGFFDVLPEAFPSKAQT